MPLQCTRTFSWLKVASFEALYTIRVQAQIAIDSCISGRRSEGGLFCTRQLPQFDSLAQRCRKFACKYPLLHLGPDKPSGWLFSCGLWSLGASAYWLVERCAVKEQSWYIFKTHWGKKGVEICC